MSVDLTELWAASRTRDDAQFHRGLWLIAHAYHCQAGERSLRLDYDWQRHPEMPYHQHHPDGLGHERCMAEPLDQVLGRFEKFLMVEEAEGRL